MAGEDPAFVSWVRTRLCLFVNHGRCFGRVEAHHAGERGLGQRADDSTCIPLCRWHHAAWHDLREPFRSMTKDERRAWAMSAIERTQKVYADSLLPRESEIPF